jgi:hypothetical protein
LVHSHAGSLVTFERRQFIQVSRADKDCALFGPYLKLPPGDYFVQFEILLESVWNLAPHDVVCRLDVAAGAGSEVIASVDVEVGQLRPGAPTKIRLPFAIDDPKEQLEFRVWPCGKTAFAAALERRVEGAIATAEPARGPRLNAAM